jgi:hypothetical protein
MKQSIFSLQVSASFFHYFGVTYGARIFLIDSFLYVGIEIKDLLLMSYR